MLPRQWNRSADNVRNKYEEMMIKKWVPTLMQYEDSNCKAEIEVYAITNYQIISKKIKS